MRSVVGAKSSALRSGRASARGHARVRLNSGGTCPTRWRRGTSTYLEVPLKWAVPAGQRPAAQCLRGLSGGSTPPLPTLRAPGIRGIKRFRPTVCVLPCPTVRYADPGSPVGSSDPHVPTTLPSRALAGVSARPPSQPGHRRDGWRRPSFPGRQTLTPLVPAHGTRAHAENRKHGRRIGMRQFGYRLGDGGAWRGAVARAAECESSRRPVWATPINARRDDHGECRSSAAVPSRGRPRSPIVPTS